MGEKAVEGAKDRLSNAGPGAKIASKLMGGGRVVAAVAAARRRGACRFSAGPTSRSRSTRSTRSSRNSTSSRASCTAYSASSRRVEDKISWSEKIWFSSRQWEGRVTEKRKNDRIVWKTNSGMEHKGIVSFHKIADNLTRVMVDMEFEPNGMMEKMASGLRFVKRAVQADLARFKTYVEMQDAKGIEYRPEPRGRKG